MLNNSEKRQQSLLVLGSLTAGILHDLNNLFTGSFSYLDLLEAEIQHPVHQKHLESLRWTLEQAQELSTKVMAVLRSETIDPQNPKSPVESLKDIAYIFQKTLRPSIAFSMHLPKSTFFPLKISLSDLNQIVLNLLVNARDAILDKGSIELRGTYFPVKKKLYFLIEVEDTGEGIPKDQVEAIFTPFYSTKSAHAGTGLGLSIVHSLVYEAGGFIEVDSIVGCRSIFRVFLPAYSNLVVD